MPTWGKIIDQIQGMAISPEDAHDMVRRQAIENLHRYTGNDVILYASGHLQKPWAPSLTSIDHSDMQGFMEAVHGLNGPSLDLILHSPGGSVEATEAIGEYLREKFDAIRVFVPHMAMSAGTILAFVADEIVMAAHSTLGPIDPQFLLQTPFGLRMVPGQAITEQFERAREACLRDPEEYPVWADMLHQCGPALLVEVDNASALSASVVRGWLSRYMFADFPKEQREEKSEILANYLTDHATHLTHSRGVFRSELRNFDPRLRLSDLESDQQLQDLVLTVYHATMHTFGHTEAAKIVENHQGLGYISSAPDSE